MIIFWILAAGLVALALLFVILPLYTNNDASDELDQDQLNLAIFHQQIGELDGDLAAGNLDQQQYDQARHDLERELLKDVGDHTDRIESVADSSQKPSPILPVALAVLVPVLSIGLYLYTGGQPDLIARLTAATQPGALAPGHAGNGQKMPPMDVLVQRLAERMEKNPDKLDGWLMLGRTYFAINEPQKAVAALARAYALAPQEPDVLVTYAKGIAVMQDGQLEGKPAELILAALEIDPTHTSGRWLNGMLMFQRGQFSGAVTAWKSILNEMDPNGQDAAQLRETIRAAQQRAGVPKDQLIAAAAPPPQAGTSTSEPPADAASEQAPPAAPASVQVSVALDPSLNDRASPDDTVFIYAKAVSGPPMPLAAQRLQVKDLPATITLDDSMAMMPQMRLSMFPQVTVGARITKSGQAIPQAGDLQGEVSPVSAAEAPTVDILINAVRP